MSISRTPLGKRDSQQFTPNASTDKIRPKSSLSSYGHDGAMDEEEDDDDPALQTATPTPRRISMNFGRASRLSDIGVGIGEGGTSATGKRVSVSRLPAPTSAAGSGGGRMSFGGGVVRGLNVRDAASEHPRPSSSKSNSSFVLAGVGKHDADLDETF